MSQQKPFSSLTGFALAALVVALAGTGFASGLDSIFPNVPPRSP
ncbi:hypothetical protein [Synechocystis salina]|nr:hypothetical protein [Synechocystis salina]